MNLLSGWSFRTGFLFVALAVLKLTLWGSLASNSETDLLMPVLAFQRCVPASLVKTVFFKKLVKTGMVAVVV